MPWFDSDIHKLCLKKERLRLKHKRTNNPVHYKKYSDARKEIKSTIKSKMRATLSDSTNPNALTKKFWSYVKNASNCSRIHDSVYRNEKHANNPSKRAELFNSYISDHVSEKSIYTIDVDFSKSEFLNYRFEENKIKEILLNIDTNKSSGPDEISGTVLKNCAHTLALPLSILFNLSFSLGQLPPDWKLANVVPIHKKGDNCDVNNYRPISLTSLVVKVMEVCIREKLYDKCINLIKNKQHGFLPGKSCTTQMIPYIDDITQTLNSRNDVDIIYFDFAKAFDSVNHDIILEKLKHKYSIDGLMLNFINTYLKDRYQRVVVGGTFSRTLPVNSGVPQGSILGPLLFVLFIDDIYKSISKGTHMALYADDTKIWRKISSYTDCIILNNDIAFLSEWACRNKMKFHPSKCKVLSSSLRHTKFYILPFDRFAYELGENVLDYFDEETDLGIVMTPKISWESQHSTILMKATRQLGLLTRTCHFIKNQSQKRALYITLVRSLFEHCDEIWPLMLLLRTKSLNPFKKEP